MAYYLGIDVSTTASKALLIDENGVVVASTSQAHTLQTPHPYWSEQDPQEWWQAVSHAIPAVLARTGINNQEIAAIGLTGQMHGLVLLDGSGKVLRPAILWNDGRTQKQCAGIQRRVGKERFLQITGNVPLAGFTAPKILWVRENEPDIYSMAKHVLLPKDYIRLRLTGEYAMDKADGAGTVLFDLAKRDWSAELLKRLAIPPEWMPPTFEGTQITGRVSVDAAAVTGLKPGTPVVAGGGDQAVGAVGMGVVEPGLVGLTVGTSGVVFATTSSALVEPEGRLHSFCHALPDTWHLMGVMLSAAGSLEWYRETLAPGMSFDDLLNEAADIPAGSEGLQFLPYLSGERTPHPDPQARGAFIGLTLRHSRGHMTRAVLEGVAFGLKDCLSLISETGATITTQVRASGGGTRSALWRQILASVLEVELVTVNTIEGAAYGAALLAGVGTGRWGDVLSACRETVRLTGSCLPDERQQEIYDKSHQVFRALYPALKSSFAEM